MIIPLLSHPDNIMLSPFRILLNMLNSPSSLTIQRRRTSPMTFKHRQTSKFEKPSKPIHSLVRYSTTPIESMELSMFSARKLSSIVFPLFLLSN